MSAISSAGAQVSHEPPEHPDAVLITTTEALLAAFGTNDLAGLEAAGAVISGDAEVARRLVAGTSPGPTGQH